MNKCGVVDKIVDNFENGPLYLCRVVNAFVDNVNKMMNKVDLRMNNGER
jgi:hypothetical protein